MNQPNIHPARHAMIVSRRRGGSLLLVLVAISVGFSLVSAYLFVVDTAGTSSLAKISRSQATQIAESGIDIARTLIKNNDAWLSNIDGGTLMDEQTLLDGTLSLTAEVLDIQSPDPEIVAVANPSFESGSWSLSNPLLSPPMSGVFGNWTVTRNALVVTGLTVPHVGITTSPHATNGSRIAYVTFGVSVAGSAHFSQNFPGELEPGTDYKLRVDVSTAGLATVLSGVDILVTAGPTVIASSQSQALLTILSIGNGCWEYAIPFTTPATMPADPVRIQLSAEAVAGVISGVAFDNVRLETVPSSTVTLNIRSVGTFKNARREINARVLVDGGLDDREVRIVHWSD